MPNLKSINDKLKSEFAIIHPQPEFTAEEVQLMQNVAAQWRGRFNKISFSGRDGIMLGFFRSPEFKQLCESPGLIQKIIAAESNLNQLNDSVYPRIKSGTINLTFGSIIKFGLPMAATTDYLRIGTENVDKGIPKEHNDPANARLGLAVNREKRYQENTLPALQALAEELNIGQEFAQEEPQPESKKNLAGRWSALCDSLLSLNNQQKGQIINVPGYANSSMIDQAHWWMRNTLGAEDGTQKVSVNQFFIEQKNASECCEGKPINEYTETCTIPDKYKSLDELTTHFLNSHLLLDEWFGHMVTDRAHLEALVFAEYPEYAFSDGSKYKMRDIIGALCIKAQENPEQYKQAIDQLNLRLGRVEDHLKLQNIPLLNVQEAQQSHPMVKAEPPLARDKEDTIVVEGEVNASSKALMVSEAVASSILGRIASIFNAFGKAIHSAWESMKELAFGSENDKGSKL
ncbi:MAG: hypothetical protein P4L79_11660 [Legionella sp.]|uniref:hypothetical protein n=1 Tax=Legionella sp. TaxID=459 RepID=UPI00284B3A00|nr:hypothetical protein [Legionella sp.]